MRVTRLLGILSGAAALASVAAGTFVGLVTGRLTIDLGIGRRTRQLGPITVDIDAPREERHQP